VSETVGRLRLFYCVTATEKSNDSVLKVFFSQVFRSSPSCDLSTKSAEDIQVSRCLALKFLNAVSLTVLEIVRYLCAPLTGAAALVEAQ
jgi:hypothetical protein